MSRPFSRFVVAVVASTILSLGCSGSPANPADAGTPSDSGTPGDSGTPSDGGTVVVTVKNVDVWCSVTVNGGTASSGLLQTVSVAPGSVVQLSAVALAGFELGPTPWHDTAGDVGSGDPGTVTGTGTSASSATTVVAGNAATCVWVCCPFTNGTGCPTTNQCP